MAVSLVLATKFQDSLELFLGNIKQPKMSCVHSKEQYHFQTYHTTHQPQSMNHTCNNSSLSDCPQAALVAAVGYPTMAQTIGLPRYMDDQELQ
jgi:hypothetical protein